MNVKTVLGIDLGLASLGYSIIQTHNKDGQPNLISFGTLNSNKHLENVDRIFINYNKIKCLIKTFKVDTLILEKVYHQKNSKTVNVINQVHGVVYLLIKQFNLKFEEYNPLQIKKKILQNVKAEKTEIVFYIKSKFQIFSKITDDTADAIAIALNFSEIII